MARVAPPPAPRTSSSTSAPPATSSSCRGRRPAARRAYIAGATQASWLKLTRSGTTFTGYVSTNGSTWTLVGSTTASIPNGALVGHDRHEPRHVAAQHFDVRRGQRPDGDTACAADGTRIAEPGQRRDGRQHGADADVDLDRRDELRRQVRDGESAAAGRDRPAVRVLCARHLLTSTKYFWQIVARNAGGTTTGPVWSFTTAAAPPPPPARRVAESRQTATTGVSTTPTLTWSSTGATSYDVKFGSRQPAAAGRDRAVGRVVRARRAGEQPAVLLADRRPQRVGHDRPAGLVVHDRGGPAAAGRSSSTRAIFRAANLHGAWTVASDPTSPNGVKLVTSDTGFASTDVAARRAGALRGRDVQRRRPERHTGCGCGCRR